MSASGRCAQCLIRIDGRDILVPMPGIYVLFIAVPLIELALLLQIGAWIGAGPTIALVVFTAIVGVSLARRQGLETMRRMQENTRAGQLPAEAVLDGVLILVAAALLLTPGVLTDAIGFFLLIPGTRRLVTERIRRRIRAAEGPSEATSDRPRGKTKVIDQDGNLVE
jgi:UPF0716 protein FxsA